MISDRQKALGQHFTPIPVAQLVGALTLTGETEKVIDPTCGDGQFLTEAARLLPRDAPCEFVGVEIDNRHAVTAGRRLMSLGGQMSGQVISDDVFLAAAGVGTRNPAQVLSNFDAVIGNPPYVRYQSLPDAGQEPDGSRGQLSARSDAASVIRGCLLASSLAKSPQSLDELLGMTEAWRANGDAADLGNPVERDWVRLVTNYSGLADLALPMWLLTRTLCRPDGLVALVTTESIYNRMYGRLLRYFMLRFMEPLLVVKQEGGGWFANAQVRAAIVLVRRRRDSAAAVTLRERAESVGARVPHIALAASSNLADPASFAELCGRLKLEEDMPNEEVAPKVAAAMLAGRELTGGWTVRMHSEQDLIRRLIDELGGGDSALLTKLEGPRIAGRGSGKAAPERTHAQVFYRETLRGMMTPKATFISLASLGIDVHQGLRTGCNQFFYVSSNPDDSKNWTTWLGDAPSFSGPHDPESSARARVHLPGIGSTIVPQSYFRPVLKTRSEARRWRDYGEPPTTLVLLVRNGACQEDLSALDELPDEWLEQWRQEGLHRLPSALDEYISRSESWEIQGARGPARIFDLSAVAPNARVPQLPLTKYHRTPEAPRWWYTLTLKERHTAPVLVARVNSGPIEAFANHDRSAFVVDANFSTLTATSAWTPAHLVAYLNSSLAAIWLEEHATPMGGGALKVEAAHLRELPMPVLSRRAMAELGRLGRLITDHAGPAFGELRRRVSEAVIRDLVKTDRVEAARGLVERDVEAKVAARSPRSALR